MELRAQFRDFYLLAAGCVCLLAATSCTSEDRASDPPPSEDVESLGVGEPEDALDFVDVSSKTRIRKKSQRVESARRDYGPLWTDLDGDGWLDIIYMNHGLKPSFQLNKNGRRFIDRFDAMGIGRAGNKAEYPGRWDRHGGSCADFDNDGDVDLFLTHGGGRGKTLGAKYDELLEQGEEFAFRDITHESGALNRDGRARLPTWVDVDRDGWLDLYVGNYYSPNVLYKNLGDGKFLEISESLGVALETAVRHGWADYNGDGRIDLATVFPLRLYRNTRSGTFRDVTRRAGLRQGLGGRSVAWGDFDDDGYPDLFVAGGLPQSSKLYRNDRGKFTAVPENLGPDKGERGQGAVWGDIDNDGDLDLIVASTRTIRLFENDSSGGFVGRVIRLDTELSPGKGVDVALGDYDGDGYVDLAVNTEDGGYLLRNPRRGKHWLKIVFQGTASNRMGIGAKVEVEFGDGRKLRRQYLGDTGFYGSAGCGPLHLGLDDRSRVHLEVKWPSGRVQRVRGVRPNRTVRLLEPGRRDQSM